MTTLLQSVTVFTTAALLLAIVTGLLGKISGRLVYLAGITVSGVCLLAGILLADVSVIVIQSVAFVSWTLGCTIRRYAARRTSQQ